LWIEWLIMACVLIGVFFIAVAGLGVLRLTDFYSRVHAPTKAATLGLMFLLVAVTIHLGEAVVATKALLAILFIAATAPVGAHVLARAAYRSGVPASPDTSPDEYAPVVARRKADPTVAEPKQADDVTLDPKGRERNPD
jgi:multicomponent Na+:H+ antiporter subunit G